jgi:hypothetical protein
MLTPPVPDGSVGCTGGPDDGEHTPGSLFSGLALEVPQDLRSEIYLPAVLALFPPAVSALHQPYSL